MKKLLVTPEGIEELELTSQEISLRQIEEQQALAERVARETKQAEAIAKKQSAIAKLKALGLDEEEVKAILGV